MTRIFCWPIGLLLVSTVLLAQTSKQLSLEQAIQIGLNENPIVLQVQKEINAAEGRRLLAGKFPNPEYAMSWNESSRFFGNANERDISLSQVIEFPTKRSARMDVASLDIELAQLDLERTRTLVIARVKQSYFNVLFSESVIEGLDDQWRLLKDVQQLLTSRYQAGENNYLDVLRTRVEVSRLQNDIVDAEQELRTRRYQLNLTLGRRAGETFDLMDSLPQRISFLDRDSLFQSTTSKSMTLKIAQLFIDRQRQSLAVARSTYLPDFAVGLANQKRAEVNNLWGIEFKVSVPLWFWYEPRGQVQEATAFVDIARTQEAAVTRRIHANLLAAFERVEVAGTQLRTFKESILVDVRDLLSTATERYQNNQLDVLNLLDVFRTYRATKGEYIRARYHYATAVTELEAAVELPFENNRNEQ